MADETDCELEVKTFIQNSGSVKHDEFYVALQCRDCGAAEIRHVEGTAEIVGPFYDGWDNPEDTEP